MESQSDQLNAKTIHAALSVINENGGTMQRLEVRDRVLESIELTPWESETIGERRKPRWWVYLNYITVRRFTCWVYGKGIRTLEHNTKRSPSCRVDVAVRFISSRKGWV